MATPYGRRAKAGPRKTLSSRLGFRYGRSASAAGATGAATGAKSFGSASSPIEPRVESETSASTLQSSPAPAPLGERQGDQPRETRSFTVAVAGDTHSRFRRGDELQVAGTGGQIRVSFEKEEFSSTGNGKALGLTVSPAKEGRDGLVAIGAKVHQLPGRAGAVAGKGSDSRETSLKPGDVLADINGRDVRHLPFSQVLGLLNGPSPHVITTTTTTACNTSTTIGSMFGSSNSSSGSSSSSSGSSHPHPHPHPHHPGNAAKKLRGTMSAASVGPRTPGSSSKSNSNTAPTPPTPPTPPSPAVLAPLSPRRYGSVRSPRAFAPLLTDVRRVSWRRKVSGKWGGGKEARGNGKTNGNGDGKANGDETIDRAMSAAFFSSPAATPTNSSSSFTRAAPLNPWGGGTPGGKPGRLSRTRTMLNSTFGRLTPRVNMSPRPAVPAFKTVGKGQGEGSTRAASAAPAATPSPSSSPSAAPPSPAGSSPPPSDKRKVLDASPAHASPAPSASTTVRCPPSSSSSPTPTTPRMDRQGLVGLGTAAAASRRGSKLRFSLKLEGDSDDDGGGLGDEEEGEKDRAVEFKVSRQASRESIMSSSSAFFPSDTESEDEDHDEGEGDVRKGKGKGKGKGGHADEKREEGQGLERGGWCKLSNGQSEQDSHRQQPQEEEEEEEEGLENEVPLWEQEEEEIVALSSYLASARRGWPWMGQKVLWAEYVSLNGHHRWIRSEQCRHALLLVRGALYLLELPKDAVARHKAKGSPSRARGSWYMQLSASDLSHLSVPLSSAQPGRAACAADSNRFEAGSDLVLHKRGGAGACAWLECRNAASRDALVDLLRIWAKPETVQQGKGKGKERPLRVELRSVAQLASGFAGGELKGRRIPSLTDERQACPSW